eukprot:UN01645
MLEFFKCASEKFAQHLLTTQNVGGLYPQEVLLILVSKLSNANSSLRDEVLKFVFKNLEKADDPDQLLGILPYCPRGEMPNVCKRLSELTSKKASVVASNSLIGFLGDPSQVSPIPDGAEKLQVQGALITVPLMNSENRIYSIRVEVHNMET